MVIDLSSGEFWTFCFHSKDIIFWGSHTGTFLRRKEARDVPLKVQRGDYMPVSKKQLEKLNKIKKAKAEDLSKQADAGSKSAKKKLKKLEKKIK